MVPASNTRNAALENREYTNLCAFCSLNEAVEITRQFSTLTHSPRKGEDRKSLLRAATK